MNDLKRDMAHIQELVGDAFTQTGRRGENESGAAAKNAGADDGLL